MDKLTITGLPPLDGEYEFDIANMLTLGHPESLTNREAHRIKTMAGIRMGELQEALKAGDSDALVALAAIVLSRRGKRVDEERLWDAPLGSAVAFEIDDRVEEAGDDGPPAPAVTQMSPPSGGVSSSQNSESPENGRSRTGTLDLVTHSPVPGSDHRTSET